ncbi:septum formation initiator family protein [Candidatus Uhrbacteria bacterium]|nr:septum formation initiator family protein [Candidatus Uhrbacteria bacterium]
MRAERTAFQAVARFGTLFIVGVVVLGFLALGFGREYLRNREIERSIAALEAQNAELEGEQLEALAVIESLSSEYYLEGEARQKRGLAKPGEELVVIETAYAAGDEDVAATADDETAPNILRWYYYFFAREKFEALAAL